MKLASNALCDLQKVPAWSSTAGKLAHQVKVPVTKAENPDLVPGTHKIEERSEDSCGLHMCNTHTHTTK